MAGLENTFETQLQSCNGIGKLIHMPGDVEFGEVGFTADDRKMLYTLAVQHQEMYRQTLEWRSTTDRRLETIEKERALKYDLDRMEARLTAAISEKASRIELSPAMMKEHDAALRKLESKVTWIWAYAMGAAAAIFFVVKVLELLLGHKS
jgi:hypothetical protein